jgi:hypothetical protein
VQDKLISLCRLYENISKTTGRKYCVRNLSFTVKLLLLENKDALASVESLEEVGKIRDAAEVFHFYLQYHNTGGDMQHLGCEIKARADRRMGNLLSALERKPGTRTDLITSSLNDMKSPAGEEVPAREKVDSEEEGGSPPGRLPEELKEQLRQRKAEVLALLTRPYLNDHGELIISFDSDPKYHWWAGGQSLHETLKELDAPPEVAGRYIDMDLTIKQ